MSGLYTNPYMNVPINPNDFPSYMRDSIDRTNQNNQINCRDSPTSPSSPSASSPNTYGPSDCLFASSSGQYMVHYYFGSDGDRRITTVIG